MTVSATVSPRPWRSLKMQTTLKGHLTVKTCRADRQGCADQGDEGRRLEALAGRVGLGVGGQTDEEQGYSHQTKPGTLHEDHAPRAQSSRDHRPQRVARRCRAVPARRIACWESP